MKKIFTLTLIASVAGFAHCNAQSTEQIDAFKKTLDTVWSAGSNEDFDSLTCMDDLVAELRPYVSTMWVNLKKNLKNGRIEIVEYIPKDELESRIATKHEDSKTYASLLKVMNKPIARGDQFIIHNLTVVGVMKIKVSGDGDAVTKFHPVGIKDGKLLFPGVKPMKQGEQAVLPNGP